VIAAKGTKWMALVDGQGPWEFAWKVPLRQKLSSRERRRRRSASTAARPSSARNTAASGRQLLYVQLCLSSTFNCALTKAARKYGSVAVFVGEVGGGRCRSVEKSKSGTFPPRLEIPQRWLDFHFFHRPCDDYGESGFQFFRKEEIADLQLFRVVCCLRRQKTNRIEETSYSGSA
jgi:hypothetical protein